MQYHETKVMLIYLRIGTVSAERLSKALEDADK